MHNSFYFLTMTSSGMFPMSLLLLPSESVALLNIRVELICAPMTNGAFESPVGALPFVSLCVLNQYKQLVVDFISLNATTPTNALSVFLI